MRVLIAEDSILVRRMLAAVLKKCGYEVVEATNGVEAWDVLLQPDAPKLVVLDWMMPEMDGLEVVRRVRAFKFPQQPYIIMLTSMSEKADIIDGLDAGADDYLTKPFDAGELHARIEVGRRLTEMQAALLESQKSLDYQATHDSLTGLLNRRVILDQLQKELACARRHDNALAVGICDIDHFKKINDTYGHQTGDEALCGVTQILRENLREYDSVGRLGGEEFLVIVPMKAGTDCTFLLDRLCARVAESKITTRSGALSVTVSIGVALAAAGKTVDEILGAADAALYRAKEQGRNRVVYAAQ